MPRLPDRLRAGATGLLACVGVLLIGVGLRAALTGDEAASAQGPTAGCPSPPARPPDRGKDVDRVVLQADAGSQTRVVNFGNDRDREVQGFAVKTDQSLDRSLAARLSVTGDTFTRTGNETAESVAFPGPTLHSDLSLSQRRKQLRFELCVDPPADLPAGQYTSVVTVEGPPEVEETTLTLTANAKDERLFYVGLILTTAFAFAVLLFKGAGIRREQNIERANVGGWGRALKDTLGDLGWWAPTVFALGAMVGALLALYDSDPAWGANGLNSIAALISAGLAAIGARSIFTARDN